ncbi:hypothetical protein Aperf_G00000057086 [Anoplocephala perfoliata]
MKSRLLEASILASNPTERGSADIQNPANLFSEELLRLKSTSTGDENDLTPITPGNPIKSISVRPTQDGFALPPKFTKPSLRGRPRFASTSNISRLPSVSPCEQKGTAVISRPASSLNLNRSGSSSESTTLRNRGNILTTSFGSLSELELKAEV